MFTGIIEETGTIEDRTETVDGTRLSIGATMAPELEPGQSVSVSGACLTVEGEPSAETFDVFLAEETVERTYLGELMEGAVVNLERAMPADGRFDGHVVQGHVDTVARVESFESVGEDWRLAVSVPAEYTRYVVEKGSITLDGISLTVATVDGDMVEVAIVPTTHAVTNLSETTVGDPLHLEVDVIAKYVETLLDPHQ